jgi:hypothetical protein
MKSFKEFLSERQSYKVNLHDIKAVWEDANSKIFGSLKAPEFTLEDDLDYLVPEKDRLPNAHILGYTDQKGSDGIILRFCKRINHQRELIEVVVHEMVHQDLARRHGYAEMCEIGHGSDFMAYAKIVKKYHNIILSQTLGDDNAHF